MKQLKNTIEGYRAYALVNDQLHWLDHLCPLCHFLNIPILVSDEAAHHHIQKNYFDVTSHFVSLKSLNLEFISQNIDIIISSSQSSILDMSALIKGVYNKELRYIYLPHGNSDKGFSTSYTDYLIEQDLSFYYGDQMLDNLKERGVFQTLQGVIRTGNFRKAYFEKYKQPYEDLAKENVFSQFEKQQTTILYAPTWNDPENLSSFYETCLPLLNNLPDHFNLIIKPHPNLEKEDPAKVFLLTCPFEDKKNVAVVNDYFAIYSLLDKTDIYLGDFSSIGYDALSFDIPLFFINTSGRENKCDKGLYLYNSGISIPQNFHDKIFDFIDSHLEENISFYKEKRKDTYCYSFGADIPAPTLKKDLLHILSKSTVT